MAFDDDSTPISPFPEDELPEDMGFDEEETAFGEEGAISDEEPDNEPANKTFIIAVAALIGFLVIAMALMAVYAIFIVPSKRKAQATQVAQINAQNTAIAQGLTATAAAALWTNTPPPAPTHTPTPPATNTPMATATPVVAQPTPTRVAAIDATAFALTATSIAMTSVAAAAASPQPTSLAQTGFADQVGLPGLLAVAALLIVVVFLARRLRQSV